MFSTKTRTILATVIAAGSFATATVAPAVSQADEPVEAPVTCSYGGATYQVGDRISVFSGAHYDNYYCGSDGEWHLVEQVIPAKPAPSLPIAKTVSVSAVQ